MSRLLCGPYVGRGETNWRVAGRGGLSSAVCTSPGADWPDTCRCSEVDVGAATVPFSGVRLILRRMIDKLGW